MLTDFPHEEDNKNCALYDPDPQGMTYIEATKDENLRKEFEEVRQVASPLWGAGPTAIRPFIINKVGQFLKLPETAMSPDEELERVSYDFQYYHELYAYNVVHYHWNEI